LPEQFNKVYQFKITLRDIKPPIWRRIQVPENYTFWNLHFAIQDAMGWYDVHLHEFEIKHPISGFAVMIGDPKNSSGFDKILDEKKQNIDKWFNLENNKAFYLYDFGDNWEHAIILEKILPKDNAITYPVCLKGKFACPPEDCGGIWGYLDLLEIINNPQHEEYENMKEWIEEDFDPKYFNAQEVVFIPPGKRANRYL
jgi:hypothetical protein